MLITYGGIQANYQIVTNNLRRHWLFRRFSTVIKTLTAYVPEFLFALSYLAVLGFGIEAVCSLLMKPASVADPDFFTKIEHIITYSATLCIVSRDYIRKHMED